MKIYKAIMLEKKVAYEFKKFAKKNKITQTQLAKHLLSAGETIIKHWPITLV